MDDQMDKVRSALATLYNQTCARRHSSGTSGAHEESECLCYHPRQMTQVVSSALPLRYGFGRSLRADISRIHH